MDFKQKFYPKWIHSFQMNIPLMFFTRVKNGHLQSKFFYLFELVFGNSFASIKFDTAHRPPYGYHALNKF